jgi:hypothetical protein
MSLREGAFHRRMSKHRLTRLPFLDIVSARSFVGNAKAYRLLLDGLHVEILRRKYIIPSLGLISETSKNRQGRRPLRYRKTLIAGVALCVSLCGFTLTALSPQSYFGQTVRVGDPSPANKSVEQLVSQSNSDRCSEPTARAMDLDFGGVQVRLSGPRCGERAMTTVTKSGEPLRTTEWPK